MKLGIDLGTSYSSLAAEVKGKIEIIKVSTGASAFGDSFSMPTAVYVDKGNILLGQAALNKRKLSPSNFKSEFKRDLGTNTPYILGGEEYLPEQLYTEFFLYFKKLVMQQIEEKIEGVYITHPANYGNNKKRLIERAANNAGLFEVVLVDEPTAAAAGYSQKSRINEGDIILVYDLGGGTFDVALIKKTSKGYVHLTEPLGISQCGGIDFDRVIFDDIMNKMGSSGEFDVERLMGEKRFTASLSEVCVQIKHQLSQAESHTEPIAVGYDYFDYTITRQEFETLIRPYVVSTCEKVKDILKNSGLVSSDIDRVLLVGGSSRVPLVRRMVQETLQKDISLDADPELAVCQGAVSMEMVVKEKAVEDDKVDDKKDIKVEIDKKDKKEDEKHEEWVKETIEIQRVEADEGPGRMGEIMGEVITGRYASDGEWIYYLDKEDSKSLYKIKIDGTRKTRLSNRSSGGYVKIEGEWVYYHVKVDSRNYNFYKVRKDGTGDIIVGRELAYNYFNESDYFLRDGWIYFINESERLTKMRIDGSCVVPLGQDEKIRSLMIQKDWIYYFDYYKIMKIRMDGTCRTVLSTNPFIIEHISVCNDGVFYHTFQRKERLFKDYYIYRLSKVRNDGTGDSLINNGLNIDGMKIIGGLLYFKIVNDSGIYSMKLDGSGKQVVTLMELQKLIKSGRYLGK